ncbi:hypothetical protein DJ84_15685 [Halorubrum ezzemoulense]|nr:hypothetical protein DJ84_15685 [Halorubrum ezzemoulense]
MLVALLEFTVDEFEASLVTDSGQNPAEDLKRLIATLLSPQSVADDYEYQAVLVGFRSQAITNTRIRAQFTQADDRLANKIQELIERGIAEGVFQEINTSQVVEYILATITGAMSGRVTTDREGVVAAAHTSLISYIDSQLIQDPL